MLKWCKYVSPPLEKIVEIESHKKKENFYLEDVSRQLPSFQNLQRRNKNIKNKCRFCHLPNESVLHKLQDGLAIQHVWDEYNPCMASCNQ